MTSGIAQATAHIWHEGQMYGHEPYTNHLQRVVDKTIFLYATSDINKEELELLINLAWLHDIFEDTKCTEHDVAVVFFGYPRLLELIEALKAITKRQTETRNQYLDRCMTNPYAAKVKAADALSNMECSVKSGEHSRIRKYAKTLHRMHCWG